MSKESTFKTFLQTNAAEQLGVEKATDLAITASLDTVLLALLQAQKKVPTPPRGAVPHPAVTDAKVLGVVATLLEGGMAIVYDPQEMAYQYCRLHASGSLVAVSYAISPGLNIYNVISSSPEALIDLGMIGGTTSDLKIIAAIFDFDEPEVIEVTTQGTAETEEDSATATAAPMPWFQAEKVKPSDDKVTEVTETVTTKVVMRQTTNHQMSRAMHAAGIGKQAGKPAGAKPAAAGTEKA